MTHLLSHNVTIRRHVTHLRIRSERSCYTDKLVLLLLWMLVSDKDALLCPVRVRNDLLLDSGWQLHRSSSSDHVLLLLRQWTRDSHSNLRHSLNLHPRDSGCNVLLELLLLLLHVLRVRLHVLVPDLLMLADD